MLPHNLQSIINVAIEDVHVALSEVKGHAENVRQQLLHCCAAL